MRCRIPVSFGALTVVAPAFLLVVVAIPAPAEAQDLGTDCQLREYAALRSSEPGPGRRVTWLSSPFLVCPDGTRIRSDSAVVYQTNRRAELMGNVRFEFGNRLLESDLADYFEREARLFARGNVVFTDRDQGTEVEGDTMVYLGETAMRLEEQVTVTGTRPTATLPRRDVSPDEEPRSPYQVIGDRLRFEGDRYFWADGNVDVVRDDLDASADSLVYDQEEGRIFLNGNARVRGEADMEGDRINLVMPDDVLERIVIRERGRLRTDDLDLVGEEIVITLADEKIQRLVAVHRPPASEDEASRPRPRAETPDFILQGDSLDVQSPDEVLEVVHAVGRARGEARPGERTAPVPVELDDDLMEVPADPETEPEPGEARSPVQIDRDWIEGDHIVAYFEVVPAREAADEELPESDPGVAVSVEVEDDEAGPQYRLTRLEASGNARSLYRTPPENRREPEESEEERSPGPPGLWSISYIVAGQISIFLEAGEVQRLEAVDTVLGLQLEPDREGGAGTATRSSPSTDGED